MFFRKKRRRKKSFFLLPGFSLSGEAQQGIWVIILLLGVLATGLSLFGQAGEIGFYVNDMLVYLFGNAKWAFPLLLAFTAISLAHNEEKEFDSANIIGLFLFLASISSLAYFLPAGHDNFFEVGGGIVGSAIAEFILPYVGLWISAAIFSGALLVSLLLLFDTSIERLIGKESLFFRVIIFVLSVVFSPFVKKDFGDEDEFEEDEDIEEEVEAQEEDNNKAVVREYPLEESDDSDAKNQDDFSWAKSNVRMNIPLDLLNNKPKKPKSGNIDRHQDIIKRTLLDFGVPVNMGEVRIGPTVTQYTFKPAKGISVSRIKPLADDLALNLAVHPVRIEAPIPGKSLVGLEVPNQTKVMVSLKEILQSKEFKSRKSNMMVSLGRDVSGRAWLDDLAKMPHLLIAGSTGSGKSIGIHSLITTLLYQNDPDDLKMILIDVKQVELTVYDKLPYLVAPVITDNKRAIRSLRWCLGEMERRLEKLKEAGCQNIADYNKRHKERMPYLVVVVDELGDLMSTEKKEVEGPIIRLGQKSRAAGIHMILATQRPSVDILSGLIKANMPARMAFSVTSSVNSKTILDFTGAEKLLGQGDMLYINSSLPNPIRVQGAYVDKSEVRAVVDFIKKKAGRGEYIEEITERIQGASIFGDDGEKDEDDLLQESKELILNSGRASATMLQTQLAIGYPRATRILSILEKQGVVGPSIQNKPREVYSDK